jgi:predicted nucleic acid-binding protein
MSLIVDASVAIKWFVEEPGSRQAERYLERTDLVAPTLIVAEVTNALWKRVRRGALNVDQALEALDRLPLALAALEPLESLRQAAMRLAIAHDHPAYDCFYAALAQRDGVPVVTADGRLAALAERVGIGADLLAQ